MSDRRDDIEKYCKGELSPAEMHALEKRALHDPFLAEALEGASSLESAEFSEDIANLRLQLQRQTKPAISFWVWSARIAAGVAVVALATFFFINQNAEKSKLAYTPAQEQPELKEPVPGISSEDDADSGTTTADEIAIPEESKTSGTIAKRRLNSKAEKQEEILMDEDVLVDDLLIPESVAAMESPAPMKLDRASNLRGFVTGYVVDAEDGKGLPGVNVTIKGTDIGTITNEEGVYQIAMDSINTGLVFSYIGFETREIVPGAVNDVNVALEPDVSQLSEVVVIGYDMDRIPTGLEPIPVEIAAPAGGKKAFKQYMVENLRYPEQAINHKVEGKVTVQFTIETNGKLSDFHVVKGLGYGCDEEVIRLIKSGPKWAPTKRNHEAVRDKVKVRMRFSLPKKK